MTDRSLYYDKLGQPIDLISWAELFEDLAYRRVAETQVGPYWISTVWLGLDHGFGSSVPVIFETMVFAHDATAKERLGPDVDCWRYRTLIEAERGHEEIVTLVRTTTADDVLVDEHETSTDE